MASLQEHMTFATFLGYHGTTISDPLLYRYAELYDNFTQFRLSIPQTSTDKSFIKWMQQTAAPSTTYLNEISIYPNQIPTHINTEPVVVSTTATSTTAVIERSHNIQLEDDHVNQLVSEYLDEDIQHQILKLESLEQPIPTINSPDSPTLSLSSLSTISPPPELQGFPLSSPPEPQSFPLPPPPPPSYNSAMAEPYTTRKDMSVMKEEYEDKKNKRKRVANISPQQQKPKKRKSGRPSTNETLTRIANDQTENDQISSQDLILRALDGSEKKKKTILTCSTKSIELYYLKQFSCYNFVGELRKKARDTIKEQKNILENLLYMAKMITQGIEPKKT
jgi:hypothetical protein